VQWHQVHTPRIYFDFLPRQNGFGDCCVPVKTAIGLSSSFFIACVIFVSFIDKQWKLKKLLIGLGNAFKLFP
jgi:hypothetical protein